VSLLEQMSVLAEDGHATKHGGIWVVEIYTLLAFIFFTSSYDATAIPGGPLTANPAVTVPLLGRPFTTLVTVTAAGTSHCCISFDGLTGGESTEGGGEGYESTGDCATFSFTLSNVGC